MGKLIHAASVGVGISLPDDAPSSNHFASTKPLSPEIKKKVASMGLVRVAGNIYECPSTKDFWKVKGTNIVKLTSDEVDNHERIAAAPAQAPMNFLEEVLGSLEF